MKIAFIDPIPWNYTVETPYKRALGGSQSAICYLAEEMAKQGNNISLFNNTAGRTISRGVLCVPIDNNFVTNLQALNPDFIVVSNDSRLGMQIKPLLPPETRLIFWPSHAHDQAAVQHLQDPIINRAWDGFSFVSNWQREQYQKQFGLDPSKANVLRNAISPRFEGLFKKDIPVYTQKGETPVLAYTSTPFRGLDVLLAVFPIIKRAVPEAKLKVFSSMTVYQNSTEDDGYRDLYEKCNKTNGVEYIGSLSQPELAEELKKIHILAYPNTFAETSCIAVMEAMASGCKIVTSDLGALYETTAGFGNLIPAAHNMAIYGKKFVEETIKTIHSITSSNTQDTETFIQAQINYVNTEYTWKARCAEWIEWFRIIKA